MGKQFSILKKGGRLFIQHIGNCFRFINKSAFSLFGHYSVYSCNANISLYADTDNQHATD